MTPLLAILISIAAVAAFLLYKKPVRKIQLPEGYKNLLEKHVSFYRELNETGKTRFEEKIQEFLGYVRIEGVGTEVTDLDKLLVASSAVIPIFGFPEWRYDNLWSVLLYAHTFNPDNFSTSGEERDTLGMVGNGPMQMQMILSKPSLYRGFDDLSGKENTGIHEFVHLLDKEDGAVDGLPEALVKKQFTIPWLRLMAENIAAMRAGKSDIPVYGTKNEAEFLAVASEYFFEQPERFKQKHPELYEMMTEMFNQQLARK